MSSTLCDPLDGLQLTRLFCPWDFSRQEYWSGLPFSSPVDLVPTQGSNPCLLRLLHCWQETQEILHLLSHKIKFIILTISSVQFENEMKLLSHVWLFVTPWTVAYASPPSMEFSRQECWSGLPFPSPGDLPNPGIEPGSPALQADALPSKPPGKPV